MHIMHLALGGCLRPPPVDYGVTQDTGGHIAYILGAANAQIEHDPSVRVTIVTRGFDDSTLGTDHALDEQSINERLIVRRLRTANRRYLTKSDLCAELPALRRAFLTLVARHRPDVIHAHFADAAELALTARRRHRMPVMYTPHSLALDKQRCTTGFATDDTIDARLLHERRAIAECDRIIVSSHDERRLQIGGYDARAIHRTVVARPGITLADSHGTERARRLIDPLLDEPSHPFVLAIARPVPKKNLPALLDAYASDIGLQARYNLVILAGQHARIRAERDEQSIELDRLAALVKQHGLTGKVAMPDRHDAEQVSQLYRLAAERGGLFVNPARHEPFGLTLIEAAHSELPVVATTHGGPREIVTTIGHGRLIEPDDTRAIADACRALLTDRRAYAGAQRACRRNAHRFSWQAWAATVAKTLDGLDRHDTRLPDITPSTPMPGAPNVVTRAHHTPDHLLACDIDGTLTGDAAGVGRFRDWLSAEPTRASRFAVATGRELPEARTVVERWSLPAPTVWITSVGTEIWRPSPSERLKRCPKWAERLDEGWDRAAVVEALVAAGVRFQARRTQRPWKVSLFGSAQEAAALCRLPSLHGLNVRLIASHGRFIDLIPRQAGKAAAIAFEARLRGLDLTHCIAAGDSGNDEDMLRRCGRAILVGNALPEIAGMAPRPGLYRACARHADGVLEGLRAFGLMEAAGATRAAGRTSDAVA